ncbi:mannitol dehydrogenase family protein [Mesorhizobium sp. CAU 1741]|uniref:mannitol dehydrogenase family protein n=1 Tax=Mesorhizobium sp. CAU 1741 TaxID=3140366 RepID=UPI00325C1EA0
MTTPLTTTKGLPDTVEAPGYDRASLRPGIFHLGPGAFMRAHLAAYTDTAIAHAGGDWGIETAGLRSRDTVDILSAQNGLYTLLVRDAEATQARVVGSIVAAHPPSAILARLVDPAIRIVSLTLTEKAYPRDAATGDLDAGHPDVAADLAEPDNPRSAGGLIVEALARRRAAGIAPFTPLSCDNLPENGAVLRRLVVGFAALRDSDLAAWIDANVPFPSTMVDRITPASTDTTYADAQHLTGRQDKAAVETEPFAQWVIEDRFASGRPDWEAAGALMVADVSPYEKMKLRMLNGTHSLVAYLGFVAGHEFMRDAMADPAIAAAARAHLACAAATLDPVPGVDLSPYADDLAARIANRAIAHRTYQIAMDGTQKLPPRIFEPAAEMLESGGEWRPFARATAAWMRYALGVDAQGTPYALRDPRETDIAAALAQTPRTADTIAAALIDLPGLFPQPLRASPDWRREVATRLDELLRGGAG